MYKVKVKIDSTTKLPTNYPKLIIDKPFLPHWIMKPYDMLIYYT